MRRRAVVFSLLAAILPAWAQVPHNQDAPPGPPQLPGKAASKMTLPDGYRVEIFASEPAVVNPVAMTFDARGRVWVAESVEYPRMSAGEGKDRIKILEDTDRDGRADKTTFFVKNLNIPSGLVHGNGGLYVANAPDLLFFRDTDGDDVADERKVLLTGFGRDDVHELPSCLTWGPDGWLYGLNGVFNPSTIKHKGKTHTFTCALWRYHPARDDFEVFSEGTSNPWGLDYDGEGSFFVSACVVDHFWHLVETGYYHRQAGPYPPHTWKIGSIVNHSHQKAAYCGLCWCDSPLFPGRYRDAWLMGNIHGSCINVEKLARNGSSYKASPEPDFLSAHDAWFMPVVQKIGPDGALWVVDWYDRYHCYQDARRDGPGIDRKMGRIYRIVPKDFQSADAIDWSVRSDSELLATLDDANVWIRRQARRLLIERGTQASELESLVVNSQGERLRREAFWTRISLSPRPTLAWLLAMAKHTDPTLRAWAARAIGDLRHQETSSDELTALASDVDQRVRLEVAIAVKKVLPPDAAARLLLSILANSQDDPSGVLPRVAWRNLERDFQSTAPTIARWLHEKKESDTANLAPVLERFWRRAIDLPEEASREASEIFLSSVTPTRPDTLDSSLRVLFEAASNGGPAERKAQRILAHLDQGKLIAESSDRARHLTVQILLQKSEAQRDTHAYLMSSLDNAASAISLFEVWVARCKPPTENVLGVFRQLLDSLPPTETRRLLTSSTHLTLPEIADVLLERLTSMSAESQSAAIDLLATRRPWAERLVAAIDDKRIPKTVVSVNQVLLMSQSADEKLQKRIEEVWGSVRRSDPLDRQLVAERMRRSLDGRTGNSAGGKAIYQRACSQCHRVGGEGFEVGPDISKNGVDNLDNLLTNIFDPNLVVGRDYEGRLIATHDGQVVTGLVMEESKERVVLKLAGGNVVTYPRSEIDAMKRTQASLMPEGLEGQITSQELADLIAFLRQQAR